MKLRLIDKIWLITILWFYGFIRIAVSQYLEYSPGQSPLDPEIEAIKFLQEYDREALEMCNRVANTEWRYATNSTEYNKRRMREQQSVASKFECISWRRATSINIGILKEPQIRRQYEKIFQFGHCGLGDTKSLELQHVLTLMKDNYNNAKVCPFATGNRLSTYSQISHKIEQSPVNYVKATTTYCDKKINEIEQIMKHSRSEAELRYIWKQWHDITGPPIRNTFMRYLDLINQASKIQGYRDSGDQQRSAYNDPNFYFTVQDLWTRIQPLYKQLFTYVRRGLVRYYGDHIVRQDGPIPAHLLGNMWAQNWQSIWEIIKPDRKEFPDINGEMIRQGFTPLRIFQSAEEFFTSMGMPAMLPEFWRNSVIQKPNEIFSSCKTSAWDFCNNIDFRIKQCTQISLEDYVNAHREMAHIHYFMQYSNQPYVFREGPNPAYHEAISQAIALSVSSPVHLQKVGLLSKTIEAESGSSMINIEFLLNLALDKLPLMAYSLSLEKWRWHIFEKGPVGMNSRWWELKLRYMGLIPPFNRLNEHFDAGSKYHVISDQEYIKYFIAIILQFQIFDEMCGAAKHNGPLHTCDIYRSRDAGRILMDSMQKGASLSSDQLLKIITRGRTERISSDAILNYFRPLEAWLEIQNRDERIIGWNSNLDDVSLFQLLQQQNGGICNLLNSFNWIILSGLVLINY